MRLDEAIDIILDQVMELLKEEIAPGCLLEGVKSIVRGDRYKTPPPLPSVWVFADVATASHPPAAIHETWELPILLVSVIKNDIPEDGYRLATRLAARARSAIMKHRTLDRRDVVQDVRSIRFEPSAPWLNEGSKYSSVAVISVRFRIMEA